MFASCTVDIRLFAFVAISSSRASLITLSREGYRMKFVGLMLVVVGLAGAAIAAPVPEIDAGSGISALTLLSGILLVIKSRKRK